jgi:hypothetical protein
MASSSPLRLDPELIRAAGAAARLHKRSVPRQIELWAEIGRAVEKAISAEDLLAVREGLARLVLERGSAAVESGDVLASLERARRRGELADRVCESPLRYQASPTRPGLLERIDAEGNATPGRFVDGEFVPAKP